MIAGIAATNAMRFVRVVLAVIIFVGLYKGGGQHHRVLEVYIVIARAVYV